MVWANAAAFPLPAQEGTRESVSETFYGIIQPLGISTTEATRTQRPSVHTAGSMAYEVRSLLSRCFIDIARQLRNITNTIEFAKGRKSAVIQGMNEWSLWQGWVERGSCPSSYHLEKLP